MENKKGFYENKFNVEKRITFSTLICNLFLAIGKLLGGIFGFSYALISDSINSFGDIVTSFITLIGTKMGSKKPDIDHPYGHQRLQSISIVIFEMVVIFSGILIVYQAINDLVNYSSTGEGLIPKNIALIFAGIAISVKFVLFLFTNFYSRKYKSSVLKAASFDHLFDTVGTLFSLIGIIFAIYFSISWIDSAMSLIIGILIIIVAIKVLKENIDTLVDKAWDEKHIQEMKNYIIEKYSIIKSIDKLSTRVFAEQVYIDLEISLDKNMTIEESHKIAESIEIDIENRYLEVIHVNIHINPS